MMSVPGAPDPEEVASAAKRLGGLRAWHTQLRSKVTKECSFASASPSSTALSNLITLNNQIQKNDENIQEMFVFCIAFTDSTAESKTFNDLFNAYTLEVEKMREALLSHITSLEKFLKPPAAAAPTASASASTRPTTGNPSFRIQTDLKPDILTKEATPEELNEWIEQFKSYYSMSKMDGFKVADQHAFFLACLDKELKVFLRGQLNNATPIWGASNSCQSLLIEKFESFYPKSSATPRPRDRHLTIFMLCSSRREVKPPCLISRPRSCTHFGS